MLEGPYQGHYVEALSFALLAFKLSMLSFYLGVLIYALPLPWAPLKRWAPRLIGDGVMGAALSVGFALIIYGVAAFGQALGVTWDTFLVWVAEQLSLIIAIKGAIKALIFAYEKLAAFGIVFPKLLAAAEFLDRVIPVIMGVLALMLSFAYIILLAGGKVLGLGLALYAAPFGVTRAVGAWLIAYYIVFMIGLPLYPLFLGLITGVVKPLDASEGAAVVNVVGASGPLQWGVLELVNRDGKIIAGFEVLNGIAVVGAGVPPVIPLPEDTAYARIRYMDAIFTPPNAAIERSPIITSVTLEVPWATWNPHQGVLLYATRPAESYEAGPERVRARYSLEPEGYVELALLEGCKASLNVLEAPVDARLEKRNFKFAGMEGKGYRLVLPGGGETVVEAVIEGCTWNRAEGAAKDYPDYQLRKTIYQTISKYWNPDYIVSIVVVYLVAPSAYMAMLFGATAGLAKVLGGSWRIPLRLK